MFIYVFRLYHDAGLESNKKDLYTAPSALPNKAFNNNIGNSNKGYHSQKHIPRSSSRSSIISRSRKLNNNNHQASSNSLASMDSDDRSCVSGQSGSGTEDNSRRGLSRDSSMASTSNCSLSSMSQRKGGLKKQTISDRIKKKVMGNNGHSRVPIPPTHARSKRTVPSYRHRIQRLHEEFVQLDSIMNQTSVSVSCQVVVPVVITKEDLERDREEMQSWSFNKPSPPPIVPVTTEQEALDSSTRGLNEVISSSGDGMGATSDCGGEDGSAEVSVNETPLPSNDMDNCDDDEHDGNGKQSHSDDEDKASDEGDDDAVDEQHGMDEGEELEHKEDCSDTKASADDDDDDEVEDGDSDGESGESEDDAEEEEEEEEVVDDDDEGDDSVGDDGDDEADGDNESSLDHSSTNDLPASTQKPKKTIRRSRRRDLRHFDIARPPSLTRPQSKAISSDPISIPPVLPTTDESPSPLDQAAIPEKPSITFKDEVRTQPPITPKPTDPHSPSPPLISRNIAKPMVIAAAESSFRLVHDYWFTRPFRLQRHRELLDRFIDGTATIRTHEPAEHTEEGEASISTTNKPVSGGAKSISNTTNNNNNKVTVPNNSEVKFRFKQKKWTP